MPDPFRSARLKIDRAKHHIHNLDVLSKQFRTQDSYEIIVEKNLESGYDLHKIRLLKPALLDECSILIGDAISKTRAAPDHMVYACAVANISDKTVKLKFKTCSFPFGNDASTFNANANGCTSVPEKIRTLLRSFQAYQGGNTPLWALNVTCNWDKHALITPILVGFDDFRMTAIEGDIRVPAIAS